VLRPVGYLQEMALMDWGVEADTIPVPRSLIREILEDGTCPLHLRMRLRRVLQPQQPEQLAVNVIGETSMPVKVVEEDRPADEHVLEHTDVAACEQLVSSEINVEPQEDRPADEHVLEHTDVAACEQLVSSKINVEPQVQASTSCIARPVPVPVPLVLTADVAPCLPLVAGSLPLAEILAVRACDTACLMWAMQRAIEQFGELGKVHDRIRTRLWIQRVGDLNVETADETVYETPLRSYANDALRRRMEAEMAAAKTDMERQIHAFQAEVDRRMEEQAIRVHGIVEDRVQQQLDTILAAEMEKVRAMVEERVHGRVRAVVQREVHATVCEMQVRLAVLARENDHLRTAFLDHLDHSDLCFRSLVWALSPNATGLFARTLRCMWCCRRRFTGFSAWLLGVPPDRRRERLRNRLEALRRSARPDGEQPVTNELQALLGLDLEEVRRSLLALAPMVAAAAQNQRAEGEAQQAAAVEAPAIQEHDSSDTANANEQQDSPAENSTVAEVEEQDIPQNTSATEAREVEVEAPDRTTASNEELAEEASAPVTQENPPAAVNGEDEDDDDNDDDDDGGIPRLAEPPSETDMSDDEEDCLDQIIDQPGEQMQLQAMAPLEEHSAEQRQEHEQPQTHQGDQQDDWQEQERQEKQNQHDRESQPAQQDPPGEQNRPSHQLQQEQLEQLDQRDLQNQQQQQPQQQHRQQVQEQEPQQQHAHVEQDDDDHQDEHLGQEPVSQTDTEQVLQDEGTRQEEDHASYVFEDALEERLSDAADDLQFEDTIEEVPYEVPLEEVASIEAHEEEITHQQADPSQVVGDIALSTTLQSATPQDTSEN